MLRPVKGKPGEFEDTIIVPDFYVELEPRHFVHKIKVGDFHVSDKYDTVHIYPSKQLITVWQARRIWFVMRLGELLVDIAGAIDRRGRRFLGYTIKDLAGEENEQHT